MTVAPEGTRVVVQAFPLGPGVGARPGRRGPRLLLLQPGAGEQPVVVGRVALCQRAPERVGTRGVALLAAVAQIRACQ